MLILCQKKDLEKLQRALKRDFKKLKLRIHKFEESHDKSTLGDTNSPFEFLGYRFENEQVSVRERSIQRMFENLNILFTQYKQGEFSTKNSFYKKLNLKITGCIVDTKRYGWIHYFSMISDHKILFSLDKFIEKKCKKLELDYGKVKKYTRAIYEIKDENSNYIESIISYKKQQQIQLLEELKNDVENY